MKRVRIRESTGPRTDLGKAIACRNAISHGILSEIPLVPGENIGEWRRHLAMTIRSLRPTGYIQKLLSERVALLLWRLGRVARYEGEACKMTFENAYDIAFQSQMPPWEIRRLSMLPDNRRLEKIRRYEAHLERCLMRSLRELREQQASRAARNPVFVMTVSSRADCQTDSPRAHVPYAVPALPPPLIKGGVEAITPVPPEQRRPDKLMVRRHKIPCCP